MSQTDDVSVASVQQRVNDLLLHGKNVYQPLYNYPYPSSIAPLRPCRDRCEAIEAEIGKEIHGRRILDVGCSLGYNTLYFVERGAVGYGIDSDERNIRICREIQNYTRGEATFRHTSLNRELVDSIRPGQYDYAFLFSILHHVIETHGLVYVQEMLSILVDKVPVLFVELALRVEVPPPGYSWNACLPDDELGIFDACAKLDIKLVGCFPTHVGPVERPLYRVARVK